MRSRATRWLVGLLLASLSPTLVGQPPAMIVDLNAIIDASPVPIVRFGTKAIFLACNPVDGCEPWVTDGTAAGTLQLADATPGGSLDFAADDGVAGVELRKSNGTTVGTLLVEDLRPGANGSDPRHITALGSFVVFQADNPPSEERLWRTDGTAPGTPHFSSIEIIGTESVGAADPIGSFAAEFAGRVYFSGEESSIQGNQLFATDSTLGGTALVKDLAGPAGDAAPNSFRKPGSQLLFTAFNPTMVSAAAESGAGPHGALGLRRTW